MNKLNNKRSLKTNDIQVLIISEHYYPIKGGSITYVHNLCNSLTKLGVHVHLVTTNGDDKFIKENDLDENFAIHRLNIPKFFRKERYFPFYLYKELPSILEGFKPDVIHIAYGHFAPLVTTINKIKDVPIVWTIHNVPPAEHIFNKFNNKNINAAFKKIYFKIVTLFSSFGFNYYRYNKIISVSKSTAEKIIETGVPKDKIQIIPNGISIPKERIISNHQKINDTKITVLTVGGIIEHKGQLDVVNAIPEIISEYPNIEFIFVGPIRSTYYLNTILSTAKSLGVDHYIKITGEVSEEELNNYYDVCDIYIQPSHQEGFCITIMEAMLHSKPVIGTSVGAIPEIIGNDRGILIDKPTVNAISNALKQMLSNEDIRDEFGKTGNEYVRSKYSWESVAAETLHLYQNMIIDTIAEDKKVNNHRKIS